ncbi:hypothetical protein SK571_13510 [Lentzea sp. BCCO 10_0798]|uniref:Phage tail tube protein n=1 Tax=Lentzea kristufekii TaxID=3095430 RepID=A0ABU4TQ36_9PSEU|nr:hypothetical protein [Lentzea sp. BCCO 10_0798]MDX8050403.1 hypothetical protein [Lentzea sp. BCCO 10_0798]
MTFMVLTATLVTVSGNDLSTYCAKAELGMEVEEKDVTTFGSLGWKTRLGGLKDGALALAWKNDLADNALDEILWDIFGNVVTFAVRAASTAVSASNPTYSGNLLVSSHKPIAGEVGGVNEFDVDWKTSGAISRAVA